MPETTKQFPRYAQRRILRTLERGLSRIESWASRLSTVSGQWRSYNPLYHLGTLTIFLLIFLTVTGLYLTLLYRPGSDRAYQSVVGLSANWFGSLVRTSHRYASDALVLVTLLHAFKMLVNGRFWGSRWLAWVSGWVMLPLFWVIGLMGYWLVWDESAQWLTEYFINIFGGAFAYAFVGDNLAAATFSLFVIILFLHVFLPILLVIGIIIHVLRLSRPRYWSPRWLMLGSSLVLLLLSWARPVANAQPADLARLLPQVPIDWWYMGFLPLADQLGNPLFWGVSLLLVGLLIALPWLSRGQHDGPARVIPAACTGCGVCARECPYDAIDMRQRDDETAFQSLALVKPKLCTGCGICVGACPDKAIELNRLPSPVVRQDLQRTLSRVSEPERSAVTVYTCERHAVLGTLPPLAEAPGTLPLLQAKLPPRVNVGAWPDEAGLLHPVMTCVVPCTGMLHPNWAAETLESGGTGAIVISCPADDCAHREGPHWIAGRLKRRRTLRRQNVHFLELPPGERAPLTKLWRSMIGGEQQASAVPSLVGQKPAEVGISLTPGARLRYWLPGLLILLLVFLISSLVYQPAQTSVAADQSQLRLAINHGGQFKAADEAISAEVLAKLPDNVDASQVLGGERYPVRLRLALDGAIIYEETFQPRGLRQEGAIYGLANLPVVPGTHQVDVWLMDDDGKWRPAFSGEVEFIAGRVRQLLFEAVTQQFMLR